MLVQKGELMRKSSYAMAFPVKDKYLLIHGLSGAVRLVSQDIAQKFFNGEVTEEIKPFFTHVTPGEELEKAKLLCAFLMKKAAQCCDSTIVVTYDCNLRCPYCYEVWVKKPETMNTVINEYKVDKAFEALEYLNKDCNREKPLVITGGEPLMKKNKDIVTHILEKGSDLGYTFTIFTNGVELNNFLSNLSSIPLDHIKITIDGPSHLHDRRRVLKKGKGSFNIITKNIEEARKIGLPLVIRTNTDAEIFSHIHELASFFKEKGWTKDPHIRFSAAFVCEQDFNFETADQKMEVYETIMDILKKPELNFFEVSPHRKLHSLFGEHPKFWPSFWNCNAVTNKYVCDPFGDIYPCRAMMGLKEQRIGVYIPELSFNENYKTWRNRTIFSLEECQGCNLALVCGGGCRYPSLLGEGGLFTPQCTALEKVIEESLEHWYKEHAKVVK